MDYDRQLGFEMRGDSANIFWGCFDAIIETDVSVGKAIPAASKLMFESCSYRQSALRI